MRQSIYTGSRNFELRSASRPEPGPGEVVVEVVYTGLCGTDVHIYHGHMDARVSTPRVIGHEMAGRVAALGRDVTGWAVGEQVTAMPLTWCGRCPACRAGNEHICHRLTFLGIDADGSLQQFWAVPADRLIRLPDDLSLRDAALVEPTAVAVHDVGRARVTPGEYVVVVGGGPVGILISLVAREAGADVVLVEPDPYRRGVAEALGLDAVDPRTEDVEVRVDTDTAGGGADVAFEVSGSAAGMQSAVAVLATRGRLCLVAIHPEARPVDLHRFFWRELELVGARLYQRADWERAVELIAKAAVPVDALVSRVVPLSDVGAAFDTIDAGGEVVKVLVACAEER